MTEQLQSCDGGANKGKDAGKTAAAAQGPLPARPRPSLRQSLG